jgi:hypothetical protein
METRRNNTTGEVTVEAKDFAAVISEAGVQIRIADTVVHEWKPGPKHDDQPSPRSRPADRKRGAR